MVSKSYLKMIRDRIANKNGKIRLKRPPKWLEPLSVKRQYTKAMYEYIFKIRKIITRIIFPKISLWLAGSTVTYPDPVTPSRSDALIDIILSDINLALETVEILLNPFKSKLESDVEKFGLEIAAFNKVQYTKTMNSVLGVDIFLEEPWLVPQLEIFNAQNAELITSMTETEIGRVSGIIQRAMQEGASYSSVVKNIENSFGITRRHARLIARDQTSKLNASLTKLRQQEANINEYIWQTSDDERVRASHKVLDGKICRWDDPTVYLNENTGKWESRNNIKGTLVAPGTDVQCRCIAIPRIEGMFD